MLIHGNVSENHKINYETKFTAKLCIKILQVRHTPELYTLRLKNNKYKELFVCAISATEFSYFILIAFSFLFDI